MVPRDAKQRKYEEVNVWPKVGHPLSIQLRQSFLCSFLILNKDLGALLCKLYATVSKLDTLLSSITPCRGGHAGPRIKYRFTRVDKLKDWSPTEKENYPLFILVVKAIDSLSNCTHVLHEWVNCFQLDHLYNKTVTQDIEITFLLTRVGGLGL